MLKVCSECVRLVSERPNGCLAIVVALAMILRWLAFSGYTNGDDSVYIARAVQVADGRFDASLIHWGARLGLFVPLATLFTAFGPGIIWVAAVPYCWSLASVVLAYFVGKAVYRDTHVALLSALFVAVFPLDVIMATQLYPSMGQAALMTLSFLAFYIAERRDSLVLYVAAGLSLGLAYLHHETAVYMLLPFALYLAYIRRWRAGYAAAVGGLMAVVAVESVVFYYYCGDPLHRVHALASMTRVDPSRVWVYHPRPGGKLFAPLVSLVTEQEYGLFYIFIAWAAVALIVRRDKPSGPLLLFFVPVALYTLWGPVSLAGVYQNAEPSPRYMAPATVPAAILLARWLLLCVGRAGRWVIVALLVSSSLACAYLDTSRTYASIGDKLLAFQSTNSQRTLVLNGRAYEYLFIANGLRGPSGVEIFPEPASALATTIDPSLRVHRDKSALTDCLVAVDRNSRDSVPPEWQKTATLMRDRRWFAEPLESLGGVFAALAAKLCPLEGYVVYEVPGPPPVGAHGQQENGLSEVLRQAARAAVIEAPEVGRSP